MDSFRAFQASYKKQMRPEGVIDRVRYALQIDKAFSDDFAMLNSLIRRESHYWPDKVMLHLMAFRKENTKFDVASVETWRELFRVHRSAILHAKFGEEYFDSIEDLALFFIHHDLRSVWVTGAFKRAISDSIKSIGQDRVSGRNGVIFTLMTFLILELDQIHRVYNRYAEITDALSGDPASNQTRGH